jgi:hypothetical protein
MSPWSWRTVHAHCAPPYSLTEPANTERGTDASQATGPVPVRELWLAMTAARRDEIVAVLIGMLQASLSPANSDPSPANREPSANAIPGDTPPTANGDRPAPVRLRGGEVSND